MDSLKDKVALVTGGARGLGEAICLELTEAGATVISADIRVGTPVQTTPGIQANGQSRIQVPLDVTDVTLVEGLINQIVNDYGSLDILVNNAGIDKTAGIEDISVDEWDQIISVNLRGPFIASKYAMKHMRDQQSGHIVNICSTAAKRAWANATAYHASKWGLLGFSHALHVEARPLGIKVTAVIAGGMRTPFLFDRFPDLDPGVLQDPRNVASTVRFVLTQPAETVIPEILVIPMKETSWP